MNVKHKGIKREDEYEKKIALLLGILLLLSMKELEGDGEFGFSARLTVSGDRVVLCDIAAKGADTQFSSVYDGSTGGYQY